jgi:hypothetical protein
MLRRETFVLKLVSFNDSSGGRLKIQLHRPASGEQFVFNDIDELHRFIEVWQARQPPPIKLDDSDDDDSP